jgi:hypothetical protein
MNNNLLQATVNQIHNYWRRKIAIIDYLEVQYIGHF